MDGDDEVAGGPIYVSEEEEEVESLQVLSGRRELEAMRVEDTPVRESPTEMYSPTEPPEAAVPVSLLLLSVSK